MNQTSSEDSFRSIDQKAEFVQVGEYVRISYIEDSGASVVLDINGGEVSMKRLGSGRTQAIFNVDGPSSLSVHNEHGVLKFEVNVLDLKFDEKALYINYQLLHMNQVVDKHVFELSWKLEE